MTGHSADLHPLSSQQSGVPQHWPLWQHLCSGIFSLGLSTVWTAHAAIIIPMIAIIVNKALLFRG